MEGEGGHRAAGTAGDDAGRRAGCDCAGCGCTAVLLLLHVSRDRDRVDVVALPPRFPAPLPAVRAVERLVHLRLDRFVQVDVARFTAVVDALHGVEVCAARPGVVPGPRSAARGRRLLNGAQALRYVRAHQHGAAGEADRVRRQQRFLAAVLRRAGTEGVLDSPARVAGLGRVLLGAARGDGRVTVPELVTLAGTLRHIGPGGTEFASAGARWDGPAATALFARLRADRPLSGTAAGARPGTPPPVRGTELDCV